MARGDPDQHKGTRGPTSVLITGAAGYIGRQVVSRMAADPRSLKTVVAMDVRRVPAKARLAAVEYVKADVRSPDLPALLQRYGVETVVHLASIVTPAKGMTNEFLYSVDVLGTRNVLEACVATGVAHLIVTSSGAAYGYHADNPEWLAESSPLRGNDAFAYSRHKRIVEEDLARYRAEHPELRQLIFRPGTILGESTSNQITALFEKPVVLGIRGAASPWVFIWDEDVVNCIVIGVHERREGIYNLAGDGVMTMRDVAARLGKPYVALPAGVVRGALRVLKALRLSQYGPEQVEFLQFRPVLKNDALKHDFGYTPRLNTRQVFELYVRGRRRRR